MNFNGSAGASDSCSGVPHTGQAGKRRIGGGFDSLGVRLNHSRPFNFEVEMPEALKVLLICLILLLIAPAAGIVLSVAVIGLLVALPVWGAWKTLVKP